MLNFVLHERLRRIRIVPVECENRHGRKEGAAVPLSRRAETPPNTMWPGPRSTSVPSGVFIHPACDGQTDRQTDRQTDGQTDRRTDRQTELL